MEPYIFRVHKYTINLPLGTLEKAREKARKAGVYHVSIYLRRIIENEVNRDEFLNPDDLILCRKLSQKTAQSKHRREIIDNIKSGGFKVNIKKFLDKIKSRQYTLF